MSAYLIEERGLFWWSDNAIGDNIAPEGGVFGTLTVDDNGVIRLELDGLMPGRATSGIEFGRERLPVTHSIVGLLKTSNQYVVLGDLSKNGGNYRSHGLSYDVYGAWTCLVSRYPFNKTGVTPKFRNMTIPLDGYEVWVGFGSIDIKPARNYVKVEYKKNGEHVFRLADKIIRLRYGVDGPNDSFFTREATYKSFGAFDLTFKRGVNVGDLIIQHRRLEDLLIILSNFERDLSWPTVSVYKKSYQAILYYRRDKRKNVELERHGCWTLLPEILFSFETILRRWDERSDLLGPGFFMYSSTRRGVKLFIETEFNNLIIGLESFDRTLNPVKEDKGHKDKLERILDAVDLTDRTWLKSKLRRSGDPNLQSRLIRILSELHLGLQRKRMASFALRCQSFRNKIVHEGGYANATEQSALMVNLSNISPGLSALYHARILKEIGLDDSSIWNIFYKKFGSTHLQIWLFIAGLIDEDPRKKAIQCQAHDGTP